MSTVIDDLLVSLGFDADVSGANRFDASLNNVLGTVGKISAAVGLAGIAITGLLGKSLTSTASQFEQFETQLTTITGSSDKAKESMAWITDFAKKTPFELEGVTAAFVKLKAYGFDPTNGILTDLGDAAGGLGKDIMVGVEAIADAVNGENERLKEAFNIKARVDTTTNTTAYTYTDVSTGQQAIKEVTTGAKDEIEAALRDIIKTNYAGGMKAMSSTWAGMTSNMLDNWTNIQNRIMSRGLFERMKGGLSNVMQLIDDNADAIDAWADAVGDKLVAAYDYLIPTLFKVWDGALWARDGLKALSDQFGITEHGGKIFAGVLALITANLIGLVAVKAITTIISLARAFMLLVSPLALIGVLLVAFGLIVQDIYGYLNGKDSVIGSLMKGHPELKAVFENIIAIIMRIVEAAKKIWTDNQESIMALFSAIGKLIKALEPLLNLLIDILPKAFSFLLEVAIVAIEIIAAAIGILVKIFTVVVEVITKIWKGLWSVLSFVFSGFFDYITNKLKALLSVISGAVKAVKAIADGDILEGIKIGASALWDGGKQFMSVHSDGYEAEKSMQASGKGAMNFAPASSSTSSTSTVTQHINVASASEAAIVANRTAQGSRQATYGYQ